MTQTCLNQSSERGAASHGPVGHSGGAPGQNGDLRIYPKSGYTVVALGNVGPPTAGRIAGWLDARLPTRT